MAIAQSNLLTNRKNRPKTAEIDVIQWDKYWKKAEISDEDINENIKELEGNLDDSDSDPEIVSIRPTFVQKLDEALKRSSESQTDPVTCVNSMPSNLITDFELESYVSKERVRQSIVSGVPDSLRGEIWCLLCQAEK